MSNTERDKREVRPSRDTEFDRKEEWISREIESDRMKERQTCKNHNNEAQLPSDKLAPVPNENTKGNIILESYTLAEILALKGDVDSIYRDGTFIQTIGKDVTKFMMMLSRNNNIFYDLI